MKRWPIIRHARYFWHAYWLSRWVDFHARRGLGFFPQESDLQFLQDVWKGRA